MRANNPYSKDDKYIYGISPHVRVDIPARGSPFFLLEEDIVKIGISTSPESRLSALSAGNYNHLDVVWQYVPEKMRTSDLEIIMHRLFKPYRMHREWFAVNPLLVLDMAILVDKECGEHSYELGMFLPSVIDKARCFHELLEEECKSKIEAGVQAYRENKNGKR